MPQKRLFSLETFLNFKNKIFQDIFTQDLVVEIVILKNNINFFQSLRKK